MTTAIIRVNAVKGFYLSTMFISALVALVSVFVLMLIVLMAALAIT